MLTLIGAWLFADFLSGVAHFVEDKLFPSYSKNKILNGIIHDNYLHHKNPVGMLKFTWLENVQQSLFIIVPVTLLLSLLGAHPIIYIGVFFSGFGNLIHRFAHTPPAHLPRVVIWLQFIGVFSSFNHHKKHHFKHRGLIKREDAVSHYCVMTNYLNPVLDATGFFTNIERGLKWISFKAS